MVDRCVQCVLEKNLDAYPSGAGKEDIQTYQRRVRETVREIASRPDGSAPEAVSMIEAIRKEIFDWMPVDYGEIKSYFNRLLLAKERELHEEICQAADPLKRALQLAMTGNYIDFAALDRVEEKTLEELLGRAGQIPVPGDILDALRRDIQKGHHMAYVTDNCGEVVLDKLLIREMLRENPALSVTVIVRGAPVQNDATLEDARQIGLDRLCRVIPNGTWMNGTVLRMLSAEAREALTKADFVIAKGQANNETLDGTGLNIYYAFLCKCERFAEKYQARMMTGVLAREEAPHTPICR